MFKQMVDARRAAVIKPAIKHTNFSLHFVIPAQAGIQYYQQLFWIPALRYAAAGMTYLIAGLIVIGRISPNDFDIIIFNVFILIGSSV